MAFDSDTRNKLARMVAQARKLLMDEFTQQLQEIYGIQPDGTITVLEKLTHLDDEEAGTAKFLRERIGHLVIGMATEKKPVVAAIDRAVREQAFTILNRFAALRMCEKRSLVEECVRAGMQSKGFKVYETIAGSSLGDIYERYKTFLFCLFDEIAVDLGVLFDRFSPQGLLFPREQALLELLTIINNDELTKLWAEDETIGWIYQYFNPPEERRAMREASQAPRNSRELAVRNQFFTPRYVVEFLTDNTLGCIWYEMHRGDTSLKEECSYLVRRPNEVFLAPGEKAAVELENDTDLSQEELLKKTAYIEHMPKKDPRDMRVLDPACGSGHFLLYAFDLLERIYKEAWEDPEDPKSEVTGHTLREDCETRDDLRRAVPKLIIEHNLHGIDIDPRAVQIATLALWLRAQKTWKNLGIKADERPRVAKSNIITAEPMPGKEDMRWEFTAGLKPRMLGQLVDVVFDKMKLAGEAGSLLKIEEEINDAIAEARKQWLEGPKPEQQLLFQGMADPRPKQQELSFDVKGITDERFWEQAEERILDALKDYAEWAENGHVARRRLFAEDAARGFAFVDLCRKRFDVVLMNPPFGDPTTGNRQYLTQALPDSKTDIGMAFVTRLIMKTTAGGRLGAITNRVLVANDSLSEWRKRYLLGGRSRLSIFLDLGYGVLDDAMVETAAYVVEHRRGGDYIVPFIRVLDERDKAFAIEDLLVHGQPRNRSFVFNCALREFLLFPGQVLAYQLPSQLIRRITQGENLTSLGGRAVQGLIPSDDFRFVRLAWEVPCDNIGEGNTWPYYAKGGEYSPYWDDIHLVVNWAGDGSEIKNFYDDKGKLRSRPQNIAFYFRPGCTYPERTTSDFCPRLLPQGCVFSAKGQAVFHEENSRSHLVGYIAGAQARPFKLVVDAFVGSGDASVPGSAAIDYRSGLIQNLPAPAWKNANIVEVYASRLIAAGTALFQFDETSRYFSGILRDYSSLQEEAVRNADIRTRLFVKMLDSHKSVEELVFDELGFDKSDRSMVNGLVGPHPFDYPVELTDQDRELIADLWQLSESDLIKRAVERHGARRQLTKKAYHANRRLELVAHILEKSASSVADAVVQARMLEPGTSEGIAARVLSFAIGCALGRWDARKAVIDDREGVLEDQFQQLSTRAPAELKESMTGNFPHRISLDGILTDDPDFKGGQSYRKDIVRCVREVLDLLWKDKAHEIEQEACDILGVSDLREYFCRPSGFFQDHLKRYSKSRRKAPIYWPLSTKSGTYTLWIYYHRLTAQTLYACVNDYVNPKLNNISKDIARLQEEIAKQGSSKDRQRLEQLMDFEQELKDYRDELLQVAGLPYKPDLNDGVMITAAPLWKLFRHNHWRKDLEGCWKKLKEGEYDWAHLAYAIWPDRVKEKCKKDLSIAIAHDLEDLYAGDDTKPKRRKGIVESIE